MIIDAHMHADIRPIENFRDLKMAGVNSIVTLAHDPLKMSQSIVTLEHFDRIVYQEPKRISKEGVKVYCGVGIHPRAIPQDYENVLEKMDSYLNQEHVIAVGEIGLETIAEKEQEIFIKQLKYADDNKYKVIVHTPRTNKTNVTKKTIELLDNYIDPKLVQLDHIDYSIVESVIDKEYTPAITVQPLKMSVKDTVHMLEKYGFNKFVLDSDISSAPSDHMSLAKVKHELEKNNFKKSDVEKVMFKNIEKFYGITF